MSIHNVAVDPIGSCGLHATDFVTKLREVGGQDGWSHDDFAHYYKLTSPTKVTSNMFSLCHSSNCCNDVSLTFPLTACRSVSCYRVSAGRIALVGRLLWRRSHLTQ